MGDDLNIRRRHLPHWERGGSTYFITFRSAQGTLSSTDRTIAFGHIRAGDGSFYDLSALVIMPDHVHLILTPRPTIDLSRIMKGIKGVTARLINQRRGTRGSIWQDESYDRIVRDEAELVEKRNYMIGNAVRRGLVADADEYPFLYVSDRH